MVKYLYMMEGCFNPKYPTNNAVILKYDTDTKELSVVDLVNKDEVKSNEVKENYIIEENDPIFGRVQETLALKSELFSGSYNDLNDKPEIPNKLSELENDEGFLKEHQSLSNLTIVEDKLKFFESQLNKLMEKGSTTITSSADFNQGNVDLLIDFDEAVTGVNTISGASITIKSLDVDDGRLNMATSGDVSISNLTTDGNLPKATSNAQISINTSEYVKITDSVIEQNSYNAIEIGLNNSAPKSILIDNVYFKGTFTNNAISIFETADNAVVTISNCKFDKCSNPLRLSNKGNNKVTVNLINCEFGETELDNGYAGIIICQDYTSTSAADVDEKNRFAPEKVSINFINCTLRGEKIAFDNQADVSGTGSYNTQLIYVYADKKGIIAYDETKYPVLTAK